MQRKQIVSERDFSLLDGKQRAFTLSRKPGPIVGYPELRGGQKVYEDVPPDTIATFYIVFDVSPDATDFTLQISTNDDFGEVQLTPKSSP